MLNALWLYRNFILNSIQNDIRSRFVRSKLGGLWAILNPLSQVAIYTLVLSGVLSAKLPGVENEYAYAIYLMAGLLAWTLFNETVTRCLGLFVEQGNLMKKMKFPRITLPVIVIGGNLVNNLFLFLAMCFVFLLVKHPFDAYMLWLLPLTLLLSMFALGLGLIIGVINVFVRDLAQVTPIILQVWFWFTPIVYPLDIIPEEGRRWLEFNPVFHFVDAYQSVILFQQSPDLVTLAVLGGISLVLLMLSLILFRRSNEEMVDVI